MNRERAKTYAIIAFVVVTLLLVNHFNTPAGQMSLVRTLDLTPSEGFITNLQVLNIVVSTISGAVIAFAFMYPILLKRV